MTHIVSHLKTPPAANRPPATFGFSLYLWLQYDARYAGSTHNLRGMDLEGSHHLDSVPEEQTPRGPPPTGTGF